MAILASRPPLTVMAIITFNILVALSTLAHAELVLRITRPDQVPPSLYAIRDGYYVNQPFLAQRFTTAEYSSEYHTNSQGYRIAPGQDPYARIDRADWLVIGDSFTQGAQVDFEGLYSTRLYRHFPDRIVVNAGISGLGLGQEYNFFVNEGRQFDPGLVILQIGSFNDFMKVEAPTAGLTEHLVSHSAVARLFLSRRWVATTEDLPLGRWVEPFQRSIQDNADFNIFYKDTSAIKQRDIDAFAEHLARFSRSVEQGNGRLLVLLVPTREQVQPRSLDEVLTAYGIPESAVDMDRPNLMVRALATEIGFELLDLLPAFRQAGDGLFFEQDEHLTARGHEIVANTLIEHLKKTRGESSVSLLSRDLQPERYPNFSADGSNIVYQAVRNGSSDLVLADAKLNNRRWLTSTGVDEAHPVLSRDRSTILFTSGSASTFQTDVILKRLDGSYTAVMTADPLTFGAIPSLSRTGRQVTFAEWTYDAARGQFTHPRIAVVDMPSQRKTFVTSGDNECWRPVFSPTETDLVYIEKQNGQFDLYLYDLVSGTRIQLTDTPYDEWDPQFTPDGRKLVYAARRDGNWDIFMLDLATRAQVQITKTLGDEWDPAVAPDGQTLVYAGRFGSFESIFQRAAQW